MIDHLPGNYGKVVEDCKNSLELDNTNIKAYYRLVKALNSLEKFEEAIKWADQGLKVQSKRTVMTISRWILIINH